MQQNFTTAVAVLVGTVILAPVLEARTCSGNGDFVGSYGFVGSRAGFFLLGATAPGSTAPAGAGPMVPVAVVPPGTVVGSKTAIGALIAGLNNPYVFASVGILIADGAGNLFTAASAGSAIALTGTYLVSSDCSVTMTLGDPFAPAGTATTGTLANNTPLQGELVDSSTAREVDLVATNATAGGAVVTLIRTSQLGSCTNASILGNYTVGGQGMFNPTTSSGGGTGGSGAFTNGVTGTLGTPFSLLGRFVADGGGNLVTDLPATTSPITRNITGTYLFNTDCSGTAHLIDQAGVTRNINFVLVNEAATASPATLIQGLIFAFSDPGVFGPGFARPQ